MIPHRIVRWGSYVDAATLEDARHRSIRTWRRVHIYVDDGVQRHVGFAWRGLVMLWSVG